MASKVTLNMFGFKNCEEVGAFTQISIPTLEGSGTGGGRRSRKT